MNTRTPIKKFQTHKFTKVIHFVVSCYGTDIVKSFKIYLPKTKLSGLKICPKGPERTESIVPGSKSTKTALGTYFPPEKGENIKNVKKNMAVYQFIVYIARHRTYR